MDWNMAGEIRFTHYILLIVYRLANYSHTKYVGPHLNEVGFGFLYKSKPYGIAPAPICVHYNYSNSHFAIFLMHIIAFTLFWSVVRILLRAFSKFEFRRLGNNCRGRELAWH